MPKPVYGRTPGPPDPAPESDVADLDPLTPEPLTAVDPDSILIHVVEDGFSTNSKVCTEVRSWSFSPVLHSMRLLRTATAHRGWTSPSGSRCGRGAG